MPSVILHVPIAITSASTPFLMKILLYPSLHFLLCWNFCKELPIWDVAPTSIHHVWNINKIVLTTNTSYWNIFIFITTKKNSATLLILRNFTLFWILSSKLKTLGLGFLQNQSFIRGRGPSLVFKGKSRRR